MHSTSLEMMICNVLDAGMRLPVGTQWAASGPWLRRASQLPQTADREVSRRRSTARTSATPAILASNSLQGRRVPTHPQCYSLVQARQPVVNRVLAICRANFLRFIGLPT